MRALTYHGLRAVRCESVPDPRLVDDGDAIVAVERAGLCGSDLHVWHGRETGLDVGTVMGHELVGRVVETGPGARRHPVGTRVVAPFSTCCGACFYCARGMSARCTAGALFGWVEDGTGLPGAQAEFVRVPLADATLVAVDDDLPAALALLLADVVPTGWNVARLGEASAGDVVVVIGCGPIGLAAVVAARFGAEPLAPGEGVAAAVCDATDGRGADAALECVGSPDASRLAFDLVRPGGIVAIAGVHHEDRFAFSPLEAYDKNLTLRIGRCPARSLMDELVPLLRRRPELAAIVTHVRPLADGPAAYEQFDQKADGCIKVAFDVAGSA